MEVILTEIEPMADIEIRTRFSHYVFRITEPKARKGFLSGGRLGAERCEAFLANIFLPANRRISKADQLEIGYCAVFYLGESGSRILTTSVITKLGFAATQVIDSSALDC